MIVLWLNEVLKQRTPDPKSGLHCHYVPGQYARFAENNTWIHKQIAAGSAREVDPRLVPAGVPIHAHPYVTPTAEAWERTKGVTWFPPEDEDDDGDDDASADADPAGEQT